MEGINAQGKLYGKVYGAFMHFLDTALSPPPPSVHQPRYSSDLAILEFLYIFYSPAPLPFPEVNG